MKRNEFLRLCGVLGIGLPLQNVLAAAKTPVYQKFPGNVLVIGSGAAGMTAGYILDQLGISYQVLEAASTYGGRIKRTKDFTDFPIPLGGEWIHASSSVLNKIVNDPSVSVDIETVSYPKDVINGWWSKGELSLSKAGKVKDLKFVNSSWLDFFETYILPPVQEKIKFDTVVSAIDYTGDQVVVTDQSGEAYRADKVIVTVPLKQLQLKAISFNPKLPDWKQEAIDALTVWEGYKMFIEFKERFYPTFVEFNIKPRAAGQKMYYDASFGQKSNKHILGLFTVGSASREIVALEESERISFVLKELDEIFEGQATLNYVKHVEQNWMDEPFINGAYVTDQESWRVVRRLGETFSDKVYFAGDAYTNGENWSNVHTAALSAIKTVKELVSG